MLALTHATDPHPAPPPAWQDLASGPSPESAWSDASETSDLAVFSWQGRDSLHARYYNPNIARFLSVDPVLEPEKTISQPQRWNRYAYALGNPIKYIDPDGKLPLTPLDALDIYSYHVSSREWAVAAQQFIESPSWSGLGTATLKLTYAMADGAALLLPGVPAMAGLTMRTIDSLPVMKSIVESDKAAKIGDGLTGAMKKGYETVKDLLSRGLQGKNQHALSGDLKGYFAVDLPGSGKGRGAMRVIYKVEENQIVILDVQDYHKASR